MDEFDLSAAAKMLRGNPMGKGVPGRITPQQKNINVARKFGNLTIQNQQGTTRIIYDSIPLDGRTNFKFFDRANAKEFPFTNVGQSGSNLGVGESLVIQRAYFYIAEIDPVTNIVTSVTEIDAVPNILKGDMSLTIANALVMKPIPLTSFDPRFNKNAGQINYNNFEFDTYLVIQSLLEFIFTLQIPSGVTVVDNFLFCVIEGAGSIISPKTTQ